MNNLFCSVRATEHAGHARHFSNAEINEHVIIYAGIEKSEVNCRKSGVAIVLRSGAISAWKLAGSNFVPVFDRLLSVRLRCAAGYVTIVVVYAPTNDPSNADESNSFYMDLQESVRGVASGDIYC